MLSLWVCVRLHSWEVLVDGSLVQILLLCFFIETTNSNYKFTDMLSEDLNTDLPTTIASVSSFISNGKICIVNNTNSYDATMNCDMSTFCHLLPNNDNVHYWCKFASDHISSHMLRILGKAHVGDDQIILFSQLVDQNSEDLTQHNLLINLDNHLTPSFTALLL